MEPGRATMSKLSVTTESGAIYIIDGDKVTGGSKELKDGTLLNPPVQINKSLLIDTPERERPGVVRPVVRSTAVVKIERRILNQYKWYRQGGLMRCCIMTLEEAEIEDEPKDGDVIQCKYCKDYMVWSDGAWQWKPDETLSKSQERRLRVQRRIEP
jgi:hypothetical protein